MAVEIISPGGRAEASSRRWEVTAESVENIVGVDSEEYAVDVETGVIVGGIPYQGNYEVTPKVVGQVLNTRSKTMLDDLTVHGVPRYDVSNEYGTTCSIAAE